MDRLNFDYLLCFWLSAEAPVSQDVVLAQSSHSLFSTPFRVDQVIENSRGRSRRSTQMDSCAQRRRLLTRESPAATRQVNMFEKTKTPEAKERVRGIRTKPGDEVRIAIGRTTITKTKLTAHMARLTGTGGLGTGRAARFDGAYYREGHPS